MYHLVHVTWTCLLFEHYDLHGTSYTWYAVVGECIMNRYKDVSSSTFTRHRFDGADGLRFGQAMRYEIPCDWCGNPFSASHKPQVHHDHACCTKAVHCRQCTRGFVHAQCNREIGAHEWRERVFGATSTHLAVYRVCFPVPRNRSLPVGTGQQGGRRAR